MSRDSYHGNQGGFTGSSTVGGYNYEFIGSIGDQFKCRLCTNVMRDAIQIQCGHSFCKSCMIDYIQNVPAPDSKCPICYKLFDQHMLFPDKYTLDCVRAMKIWCPCLNCQIQGTIPEIEHHINFCEFRNFVMCEKCLTAMDASQLQQHIETCRKPDYTCNFCRLEIIYANKDFHESICPHKPIFCPHQCGVQILRMQLKNHEGAFSNNSCTFMTRNCPYEKCPFKGTLHQLNSHLTASAFLHASLYQDAIENLKGEVNRLDKKNKELENELRKLEKLHKGLAQCSYGAKQKTSSFFRRFMPPYNGEDWEDFQEALTIPTNGMLIWKISDFKETFLRSTKYTKIYSRPFYTSPEGFKLCCYLQKQDNQVMIVYFQIMKGEFDEILDSLSNFASVLILNKIRSSSISYDVNLMCDYNRTSTDVGCVELLAFQQILHFMGSSSSLFIRIEVK